MMFLSFVILIDTYSYHFTVPLSFSQSLPIQWRDMILPAFRHPIRRAGGLFSSRYLVGHVQ